MHVNISHNMYMVLKFVNVKEKARRHVGEQSTDFTCICSLWTAGLTQDLLLSNEAYNADHASQGTLSY